MATAGADPPPFSSTVAELGDGCETGAAVDPYPSSPVVAHAGDACEIGAAAGVECFQVEARWRWVSLVRA